MSPFPGTSNDEDVYVQHDGIVLDEDQYRAILFKIADEDVWIPRSVIVEFDENSVTVPRWKAQELGVD